MLTIVKCDSSAAAPYTNADVIVRARLIVIRRLTVWNAVPNLLLRKQRKQKRALEIIMTKIAVVNLHQRKLQLRAQASATYGRHEHSSEHRVF